VVNFSKAWKIFGEIFQSLDNFAFPFPIPGKAAAEKAACLCGATG
jgi:hypothetical protein